MEGTNWDASTGIFIFHIFSSDVKCCKFDLNNNEGL